jgi:DNA-binding CsgD family transcriptional regulator/tetratricopeptide (TPR) repeat protein
VSTLVGRAAELARLGEVVEACRRGERAVAFVGGEAGVGKTRLITELAEQGRAGGAEVLIGGCLDLEAGGFPYEPIVEALRDALDGSATFTETLSDTFTMTAVPRALEQLSQRGPVLLVVEDVHWADRSTRDLISYLASTGPPPPLALVLTYRSDGLGSAHPIRRFVAELERRPSVTHLRLDRLGRADAAALLTETLGRPPDPAVTEMIYQRSEGNPFFLQELARASAGRGGELPPLLADVLSARIEQLSPATQEVLRIAAVGGRRVSHERLAAVAPMDEDALARALREARDADIIQAHADDQRYQFRHALLHEAVYDDVLPGERAHYHARYAELLAATPTRGGIEGWAELAHHWRAAGRTSEALVATIKAGMAAEAGYALPEAARYYELALELWEKAPAEGEPSDVPSDVPLTRLEVLARAADAASRTGAFTRAVELTTAAIEQVDADADPTTAGLLNERRAWYLWRAGDERRGLSQYEQAVDLVPAEPPSAARARVLAAYADALGRTDRFTESRVQAEEAVAIATAVEARFDEGHARHILGLALCALGDTEAGVEELHHARRLAEANGDIADVAGTYVHLWRELAERGRAEEMVRIAEDAADFCRAADLELAGQLLDCLAGGFLHQLGRWPEATARLEVDERDLWGLAAVVSPAVRGALEVDRGEVAAAREHLETARCLGVQVHDGRINGLLYRGLAELAVWEGRPEDALTAVTDGVELTGDDEMLARLCIVGLRAAADLSSRERREAGAAPPPSEVVDALRARLVRLDRAARARRAPPSSEVRAAAATGEAELTRAAGRSEPARWSEALRRWDRLAFPGPAAYCRWRLAEAVLAEGRRADALPLWREAHQAAVALGAGPLQRAIEVDAARAAIPLAQEGEHDDRTDTVPFGLTARELEVLSLVAAGRTNRQIGEQLFISEKTASVHVSRILVKLGARTRAQAAALAVELGLAGGSAQASR